MPKFVFTFHECDGNITADGVAREAVNLDAARELATERAREIMAAEVRKGRLCISCWIVISDQSGHYLATVQFFDALEVRGGACNVAGPDRAITHQ